MKKIEQLTSCYDVSKTLRFKAIPVGKTQENIDVKNLIEEDEQRAESYKIVKKIIDRYHKSFIEKTLTGLKLNNISGYIRLYMIPDRTDDEELELFELEEQLRKEISDAFINSEIFNKLFKEDIIKTILPDFLDNDDEIEQVLSFVGFTTAFTGFFENRKNLYSAEAKSTGIANRCINDNLPRFISNITTYDKISSILTESDVKYINDKILSNTFELQDCFCADYFDNVLSEKGIVLYNTVIGGFIDDNGNKVKGINEYINLYNQKNKTRLPLLTPLYKQLLSDRETMSFYSEGYTSDEEVYSDLYKLLSKDGDIISGIDNIGIIFDNLSEYSQDGIYIKNDNFIKTISNYVLGDWNAIRDAWNTQYDREYTKKIPKNRESYNKKRDAAYKKITGFSLKQIEEMTNSEGKIQKIISRNVKEMVSAIHKEHEKCSYMLKENYKSDKKLQTDEVNVANIKRLLDAIKNLEVYIKSFMVKGKETERDEVFYGEFLPALDEIITIDNLYNSVRNYVTKKPYSNNKFKLYFQNPQFMGGWSKTKESDYRVSMLEKNGLYYLAVIDKEDSKCLQNIEPDENGNNFRKMNYQMISGASKSLPHVFWVKSDMKKYGASDEVIRIYKEKTFIKGDKFNLDDCHKLIDYYKSAISQYSWSEEFDFKFSETSTYKDISGFFREVDEQGYKLSFENISASKVNELVESGNVYLFQLYCKDFSEKSHGTPNLHTLYFKMLFDEQNRGVIRLCGGAELFLRKASLKKDNLVVHPANLPMNNKNPDNPKKTTALPYNVYKDRRYAEDQYEIHIPIVINKIPKNNSKINSSVKRLLREEPNPYVIGINRGERNLIYVVVVDGQGKIIEQYSLNEIVNKTNGVTIKTDYNKLLEKREGERQEARQNWTDIKNIKELKEGYISQVVHKICELVVKYDAVIAIEDLNSGFKNSRVKVEKQIYQKFEKMMIDKLNYLCDKKLDSNEYGGLLKGYQLTNKFDSFSSMAKQNGIMFYVPAWLSGKTDPITGFTNLLRIKYVSVAESQNFLTKFDDIFYDADQDLFAFNIDYRKFDYADADYQKEWTLYSYGERVRTFKNPKTNKLNCEYVELTKAFKTLFDKYGIDYENGSVKNEILKQNEKSFFEELLQLISLMVQMRNMFIGKTEIDFVVSPVKSSSGEFYDSRNYADKDNSDLPKDSAANGAYNLARKVLWIIEQLKESEEGMIDKTKITISNAEWLQYAQTHTVNLME